MGSAFDDAERRGLIYANERRSWIALPTRFNDEIPQMTVYLDAFEIDQVEVTHARYRHCVEAGICRPASDHRVELPKGYATDPCYNNYPAIGVSWFDAYSYCQWVSKRLPTEAEWEKAARGTDGRHYPWGDEWEPTYGCIGQG
jgi:formylglycine-generating enzyme required for sulfatase activity